MARRGIGAWLSFRQRGTEVALHRCRQAFGVRRSGRGPWRANDSHRRSGLLRACPPAPLQTRPTCGSRSRDTQDGRGQQGQGWNEPEQPDQHRQNVCGRCLAVGVTGLCLEHRMPVRRRLAGRCRHCARLEAMGGWNFGNTIDGRRAECVLVPDDGEPGASAGFAQRRRIGLKRARRKAPVGSLYGPHRLNRERSASLRLPAPARPLLESRQQPHAHDVSRRCIGSPRPSECVPYYSRMRQTIAGQHR